MKEDPETRSRTMRAVKGRNTAPELAVRHMVFALGYRYRLYRKDLPGKPDLTFPQLHKVIFVHGCFWHGHNCARGARTPSHNREYWMRKIAGNAARDKRTLADLQKLGWKTHVVWECELKDPSRLEKDLKHFLKP